jgi:voltage-gated potassium channel
MSMPAEGPPRTNPDGTPITKGQLAIVIAQTILRLVLGLAAIILVMVLVPDDPDKSALPAIGTAIVAIAIYAWFFRRQLRGVERAKYPTLRAAEALVLVAAMFLAIFAVIYVMISQSNGSAFTEQLDAFSAYYFSLTVLATVGFGDIAPVTVMARSVTMVQMAFDIVFIAVLVRVLGTAARRALSQRAPAATQ